MIRVFHSIDEWRRDQRAQQTRPTLGFVPTMGALHEGHLSLVRRSTSENAQTLVSIFINRMQFDNASDFTNYPRTVDEDIAMLEKAGVDFVLVPTEDDLYLDAYGYRVSETEYSRRLEGEFRPGHFEGVLTIVLKLLHIADASKAYFGEKDWQQLVLVRGMADAFFLPTQIVGCSTVRERDGLAMSSRNRRLSPADRAKAARFYEMLRSLSPASAVRRALTDEGFVVDYVQDDHQRRHAAVRLGGVRLIDNIPLEDIS